LVPTVGQEALEAHIRAGSAFTGIGDTVTIGRVLYAGDIPIQPNNECWVPDRIIPTRCMIVPIGDIHVFIGDINNDKIDKTPRPVRTSFELDMYA
jgi:hypothetical protein